MTDSTNTPAPSNEATLQGTIEAKIQLPGLLASLAGLVQIKPATANYQLGAQEFAVLTYRDKITTTGGGGETGITSSYATIHLGPHIKISEIFPPTPATNERAWELVGGFVVSLR